MKLNHLFAASLLIVMISCKSKTAFDYSEAIVKMEAELSTDIASADQKVSEYLEAKEKDNAILMSREMELLAEEKLKEIKDMKAPDVEEADNFKKAAIRYFSYVKSIYSSFKKYTMAATDQEKEAERKKLSKIIAEKKIITEHMKEAQRKFAAANDFYIGKVNGGEQ